MIDCISYIISIRNFLRVKKMQYDILKLIMCDDSYTYVHIQFIIIF